MEIEAADLIYASGDNETLAVRNVSLTVERGKFVALVGPSGCGKSTLLKLVAGLVRPSRGVIRVHGQPVLRPLKIVGMAFQNPTLLPWRTALENVLLPLEIVEPHKYNIRRDRARHEAVARDLLATVGLRGFENRHPWELSGGMQQRASLCRALIHEPELMLLDEPFGALDAFTREELWAVLQQLWLEKQFTVILVTHDLREAMYLADKIFVMSARPGRVILERAVDLARPRTLEDTFAALFVDTVADLRSHISHARETADDDTWSG